MSSRFSGRVAVDGYGISWRPSKPCSLSRHDRGERLLCEFETLASGWSIVIEAGRSIGAEEIVATDVLRSIGRSPVSPVPLLAVMGGCVLDDLDKMVAAHRTLIEGLEPELPASS